MGPCRLPDVEKLPQEILTTVFRQLAFARRINLFRTSRHLARTAVSNRVLSFDVGDLKYLDSRAIIKSQNFNLWELLDNEVAYYHTPFHFRFAYKASKRRLRVTLGPFRCPCIKMIHGAAFLLSYCLCDHKFEGTFLSGPDISFRWRMFEHT